MISSGEMTRYPLISKVILMQVAINFACFLVITLGGFFGIKSISNQMLIQYKSSLTQIILPNFENYVSWYLLDMPILQTELDNLKNKYQIKDISILNSSQIESILNKNEFLIIPSFDQSHRKASDYFLVIELKDDLLFSNGVLQYWYSSFIFFILLSIFLVYRFNRTIKIQLFTALDKIDSILEEIKSGNVPDFTLRGNSNEFHRFISGMNLIYNSTREVERSRVILNVTRQVSHDIRSPLSALSMAVTSLKNFPEEQRLLIRNSVQRINDIANELLQKSKESNSNFKPDEKKRIEFIPAIIESLVSEKRMQFRENDKLNICLNIEQSYGAFSTLVGSDIKRIISNLINNSVEAMLEGVDGQIEIEVLANEKIEIYVRDNGKGIPLDILLRLGNEEITSGKQNHPDSGSGIGIHNATKIIRTWGGEILISSEVNKGTEVKITLDKSNSPSWFCSSIDLKDKKYFITVDDDSSIHELWRNRLQEYYNIEHLKFQSLKYFADYVSCIDRVRISEFLFAVDFEFLNQSSNGIDAIRTLDISDYSILVTSRYDEIEIQKQILESGIKLLPKQYARLIPISPSRANPTFLKNQVPDWVLIDDDSLSHLTWKISAKSSNKQLLSLQTMDEFLKLEMTLPKNVSIYVDENLANGVKGQDVAAYIFNKGFTDVYLTTGHPPDQFGHLKFLKGIIGKDPPSSNRPIIQEVLG